jgi:hypothetical protein
MSDLIERPISLDAVIDKYNKLLIENKRLTAALQEIIDNDDSYYRVGGSLAEEALSAADTECEHELTEHRAMIYRGGNCVKCNAYVYVDTEDK